MSLSSGVRINVGGLDYWSQNGNTAWGLTTPDEDTFRFEVRSGDEWQWDPSWKERSELAGDVVYEPGETLTVKYSFMIEPGAANTADWLILGQFHADDGTTSPPLAVELVGEKLAIVARYQLPGESAYKMQYVYVDDAKIARGQYYDLTITANFENNGKGFINVWRDGELIVDYDGPLGYGYGVYWKHGIYREESNETIAVNYKDFSLTTDGGVIIVGTDDSDAVSTNETPEGQPETTDQGDVIIVKGSDDEVVAGGGSDVILTGDGNDTVDSGAGNDKIDAAAGNDILKGGSGKDVFKFAEDFGNDVIRDYRPNKDKILFESVVDSYRELKGDMNKHEGGTLITVDDDTIFLCKVKMSKLDAHDFLFT